MDKNLSTLSTKELKQQLRITIKQIKAVRRLLDRKQASLILKNNILITIY